MYAQITVMSQSQYQLDLHRKHIASLTQSEMIMLNLKQLQHMQKFNYDLAITEEDNDNKIYAFTYQQNHNSYLLMVPDAFYHSNKNRSNIFVQMLCLCSQTITLPLVGSYYDEVTSLLSTYCLKYRYKKGKNVIKLYLSECWVSYLDFVTFQAIQFKQKGCKQLLAMKKSNSFQFCINNFRQEVMPQIFSPSEESIQNLLENEIANARQMYVDLVCEQRFSLIYQLMNEKTCTLKQLQKQIEEMVLSKHIPTVADEQYNSIINSQLENLVSLELSRNAQQLREKDANKKQFGYMKIVYQLLNKLRQNEFQINDDKYLFITSKIILNMHVVHQEQTFLLEHQNQQLTTTVHQQNQEIGRLQNEIEELKLQLRKKKDLAIVMEEKDENKGGKEEKMMVVKRSSSEMQLKEIITIKDLKEPLQMMNFNTPINKSTNKIGVLTKSNQKKLKSTLKKRGDLK